MPRTVLRLMVLCPMMLLIAAVACSQPNSDAGNDGGDIMNDNGMMDGGDGATDGDGGMADGDGGMTDGGDGMTDGGMSTRLVTFQDPNSDFSTSDVRDVEGDIVQFDATTGEMIWTADGQRFEDWQTDGNTLSDGFFTIRFGTEDGEQRAYFTETGPATICDIVVNAANLQIFATNTPVPMEN